MRTLKGMPTKHSCIGAIKFEGTRVDCGLQGAPGVVISGFFVMGVVGVSTKLSGTGGIGFE